MATIYDVSIPLFTGLITDSSCSNRSMRRTASQSLYLQGSLLTDAVQQTRQAASWSQSLYLQGSLLTPEI